MAASWSAVKSNEGHDVGFETTNDLIPSFAWFPSAWGIKGDFSFRHGSYGSIQLVN